MSQINNDEMLDKIYYKKSWAERAAAYKRQRLAVQAQRNQLRQDMEQAIRANAAQDEMPAVNDIIVDQLQVPINWARAEFVIANNADPRLRRIAMPQPENKDSQEVDVVEFE